MEPFETTPEPTRTGRSKGRQFGIRALILLVAVVAAWTTVVVNRRESAELDRKIAKARPMVRELVVDDPKKAAVVRLEDLWHDETRWDVYFPEGSYRLCLATRGVDRNGGIPGEFRTVAFPAGRHRVELRPHKAGEGTRIDLDLDGTLLLGIDEAKDWAGNGSGSMSEFSDSKQIPADGRIVLFRRTNMQRQPGGPTRSPNVPTAGIMLWIEPASGAKPGP